MSVHYKTLGFASRDHEKVSRQWYVLLHDIYYGHNGPALKNFNVNEGHRTMARQAELVREQGLYSASNPHGAAAPSATAPHIKTGHPDHAIDFDNAEGVRLAAAHRGVTLTRTVSTESWHLEPNPAQLARYYNANKARVLNIGHRTLHPGMSGRDVRDAMRRLQARGFFPKHRKLGLKYGHTMHAAVNKLKAKHHLPRDGAVGKRVWKVLGR